MSTSVCRLQPNTGDKPMDDTGMDTMAAADTDTIESESAPIHRWRAEVWGVGFGIVGARLYHDATSWSEVPDKWWGPFAVWEGGLGVWGGILFGAIAGGIIVRRSGASVARFADAAAPGLLLAQGIGRIGNWWDQELYGKPTDPP